MPGERGGTSAEDIDAMLADFAPTCWDETGDAADDATDDANGMDDSDAMASDYDGIVERECTPEETAEQRAELRQSFMESRESEQRQAAAMMRVLGGIDIEDDETMRAYAARLARQTGWNSVVYRGNRVFEVDYRITGSVNQGFVFPVLDGFEISQPMVVIAPRADGTVRVQAPGFANDNSGIFAMMIGGMADPGNDPDSLPLSRARGRFTLRTDGDVRTNNTENGPSQDAGMSVLSWPLDGIARPKPEALIRLSR